VILEKAVCSAQTCEGPIVDFSDVRDNVELYRLEAALGEACLLTIDQAQLQVAPITEIER
jgi:hypothetical protein